MKTSLEKTTPLGRKLSIEVPVDKVTSTFDKAYKGLQKNANIKGFRKGKAPINVIKNLYADRVKQDVLEELVSEAYTNALTEHALTPVSQPKVNVDKFEEALPFQFTAEFEIRPEVTLKKIEKLKVQKEKLEVSDESINSVITRILESRANLAPVLEDRAAMEGDTAEIDFDGFIDEKPLEGGSMKGHKLELGSKNFIPGFEEGIVGMKVGAQKTLNLSFPADYGHKDIAGKPVRFEVTLKALLKKVVPELNEEFVKSLGGINSVDELKNTIRQDLTQQETQRIHDDLKSRILKALVEENPVEIPQTLHDRQKEFLIADVEKRMQQQGMSESELVEYKNKWAEDFNKTAAFMIQSNFLIDAIAEKNNLFATQDEFKNRLAEYAKSSNLELAKLTEFYSKNPDRRNQMKYQITEEKVVDFLIGKADLTEVSADKLKEA